MRFDKFFPIDQLKHFIKYFAVFPSTGLVIGFQYSGQLSTIKNGTEDKLTAAGITGISDSYKAFRNSANIGTILVYFTEIGFAHFASHPVHELFNLSISLEEIFDKNIVSEIEEKLTSALTDKQRIHIVEKFLISQLKDIQTAPKNSSVSCKKRFFTIPRTGRFRLLLYNKKSIELPQNQCMKTGILPISPTEPGFSIT